MRWSNFMVLALLAAAGSVVDARAFTPDQCVQRRALHKELDDSCFPPAAYGPRRPAKATIDGLYPHLKFVPTFYPSTGLSGQPYLATLAFSPVPVDEQRMTFLGCRVSDIRAAFEANYAAGRDTINDPVYCPQGAVLFVPPQFPAYVPPVGENGGADGDGGR